jgi:hypothetical protein
MISGKWSIHSNFEKNVAYSRSHRRTPEKATLTVSEMQPRQS